MSWCPKCKEEYEDHVKICPECQTDMIEQMPKPLPKEKSSRKKEKGDYDGVVKLCNVASTQEAVLIESILISYDIPVMYKSKGSGDYLQIVAGVNYQGVDIYVPSSALEAAQNIIQSDDAHEEVDNYVENEYEEELDNMVEYDNKIKSRSRFAVRLLLVVLIIIPLLILLILGIFNMGRLVF